MISIQYILKHKCKALGYHGDTDVKNNNSRRLYIGLEHLKIPRLCLPVCSYNHLFV